MWLIIILGMLVVGGAVTLVVVGLNAPQSDEEALQRRLEEFSSRGETINLEKIELSQPFTERIVYPLARRLGDIATKFTPASWRRCVCCGRPARRCRRASAPTG